jgi:hypothetical protein
MTLAHQRYHIRKVVYRREVAFEDDHRVIDTYMDECLVGTHDDEIVDIATQYDRPLSHRRRKKRLTKAYVTNAYKSFGIKVI